jgi:GT2 family glycosyltransferase
MLARVDGAEIHYNTENLGFLLACNSVAQDISTPYTLFLNNDCELLATALDTGLETIQSCKTIGAVGGKIILLNGELQEAGSIVYADGSCAGYGRGRSPDDFEFQYERDVDFVSGAFMLTQTSLFQSFGGFDDQY